MIKYEVIRMVDGEDILLVCCCLIMAQTQNIYVK